MPPPFSLPVAKSKRSTLSRGKAFTRPATQPDRTGCDAFDNGIVNSDEDRQPLAHQRANRGHAANIGGRFLHRLQVVKFRCQLMNLLGREIGSVRDGVVVQHGRAAASP